VLRIVDEASDAGTDMQVLIRSLIAEFRHMLVGRIDPELLSRDLAPEDAEAASARAQQLPQAQIVRALRLLTEALATARSSGHPRLELETALLRYVLASEDPTLEALGARLSALEEGFTPAASLTTPAAKARVEAKPRVETKPPAESKARIEPPQPRPEPGPEPAPPPGPQPRPEPQPAPSPITIQKVRAAWQSIRSKIEGKKESLRTQLSRAVPDSLEGSVLVLKLPNSFLAETLKDNGKLVESVIADVLGTPLKVQYRVDGASAAPTRGKGASASSTASVVEAQPEDDPDLLFSYLNERIK